MRPRRTRRQIVKSDVSIHLTNFLAFFDTPNVVQQCNDNSNLETILLAGLGVGINPLFISSNPSWFAAPQGPGLVATAPYFGAGSTFARTDQFTFHQFCLSGGLVFDPSTRPASVGNPFMNLTLINYLNAAFPGQVTAGFCDVLVDTVAIGNVVFAPFTLTNVTPNSATPGTTTTASINGAGFVHPFPFELSLVEPGGNVPIADATITSWAIVDSTTLTANIQIDPSATPRTIEILGLRAIPGMDPDRGMVPFNIIP